ncbi:hypothetical protein [Acetobacter lambici]|uniref:Uncharacterized protein n=1 Tax=Acetobacter lambici TaxID=1332824 RepID=A0ABT1EXY1_9PROT|nr:hypothetical protein [Acetobacter lambici]MCP1241685.1 hypothetical protein [Acetobacter lambici]MCP1257810.1 hypothetical protein [Acetobacter lambici]
MSGLAKVWRGAGGAWFFLQPPACCLINVMILHDLWRVMSPPACKHVRHRGGGWAKKAFGHGLRQVTWALNVMASAPILMAQGYVMTLHCVPG